jgi:hypothetical protein
MITTTLLILICLGALAFGSVRLFAYCAEEKYSRDVFDWIGEMLGETLGMWVFVIGLFSPIVLSTSLYCDLDGRVFTPSWPKAVRWFALLEVCTICIFSMLTVFGELTGRFFSRESRSSVAAPSSPDGFPSLTSGVWALVGGAIGFVSSVLGIVSFYLDHLK